MDFMLCSRYVVLFAYHDDPPHFPPTADPPMVLKRLAMSILSASSSTKVAVVS